MLEIPTTVGSRVHFYRLAQGLSAQALADMAGIHRNHLRQVEANLAQMTVPTLQRVAKALGVTCAHLLGEVSLLDNCPVEKA